MRGAKGVKGTKAASEAPDTAWGIVPSISWEYDAPRLARSATMLRQPRKPPQVSTSSWVDQGKGKGTSGTGIFQGGSVSQSQDTFPQAW